MPNQPAIPSKSCSKVHDLFPRWLVCQKQPAATDAVFFFAADFCGAGASLQTASNYKSESSLATKTERTEITEVTEISTSEEMDCWEPQTGRMLQH